LAPSLATYKHEAFRELLFTLDHGNVRRSYPCESKPVSHSGLFRRIENDVTNSDIQVEFDKGTPAHDRFDRIPRSAIGSAVEVHYCFTNSVMEKVTGIFGTRILKLFEQPVSATGLCNSHREIEIPGGTRCLEPEFHCVAALQNPVCGRREKPGEESIKCDLSAQALQVDSFFAGYALEAFLQHGAEREASDVLSFGGHVFPFRISARTDARPESF
jgi:hypothetical protein